MIDFGTCYLLVISAFVVLAYVAIIYIHDLLFQISRDLREMRLKVSPEVEELESAQDYKKRYRRTMIVTVAIVLVLEFLLCSHVLGV